MRRTLVMEPHWIPSSVSGTEIWQGSASECGVNCHCREAGSRDWRRRIFFTVVRSAIMVSSAVAATPYCNTAICRIENGNNSNSE